MSNLRQAAQQALEAWFRPHGINYVDFKPYMEALRAALAEPEQKVWCDCGDSIEPDSGAKCGNCIAGDSAALAEPKQEPTKQKPVAWTDGRGFIASHADSFPRGTTVSPLYAHPPAPSKPLTDDEIAQAMFRAHAIVTGPTQFRFAREIERAHGIGEQHE